MPGISAFSKLTLVQATPAALGEIAINPGGQLQIHNGSTVDVYGPATPAGSMTMWAGPAGSPPTGYLICDGSSQLQSNYPALFAAIGVTYGSVDGTHFNVPDLRGRAPVAYAAGDADFGTVGQTGGAKTVASASHTHSVAGSSHTHNQNGSSHSHSVAGSSHSHNLSILGWAQVNYGGTTPSLFIKRTNTPAWTANVQNSTQVNIVASTFSNTSAAGLDGTTDAATPAAVTSGLTTPPDIISDPTTPAAVTSGATAPTATSVVQPYLTTSFIIKF